MFRTVLSAALAACLALTAIPASAQFSKILRDTGLSQEDFNIMGKASQTLYVSTAPKVGAETIWQNPETGSHGTTEVEKIAGNCVTLRHLFVSGKTKKQNNIAMRQCKDSSGVWVLTP
ncbi:hypothetical protein [Chachezhania antarctica]|uniref:hypothetical protein n=1 Tax=Chachezhania antarctica TaxID=2340860 RepID=UPI0013CE6752|nr:hypothetical protein [Chachezhania antarctica]